MINNLTPDEFKKHRKSLGLSQQALADKIGVDRRTIINYEKGGKIPESIVKLIHYMRSEKDSLSDTIPGPTHEYITNAAGSKILELPDGTYDIIVKNLPFNAYANYLATLEKGGVLKDLKTTTFNIEKHEKGNYLAFTVKGESMDGGSINDTPNGAKVLGLEYPIDNWKKGFRESKYGYIILCDHNIFHKDIIDFDLKTNEITVHSRNTNPEYSDFKLKLCHIKKVFKVIKRMF